jgi:CRISPR-associated protein Cmr4
VTSPEQLRISGLPIQEDINEDAIYREKNSSQPLNLGWLLLPVKALSHHSAVKTGLQRLCVPNHILNRFGLVSDKLFSHVVNSNLEVRTSVSINPETGAAEDGALFTYEALPRATLLFWDITCKNPKHFKIGNQEIKATSGQDDVHEVVKSAHPYLEHLGIGGMGTRGMGRLKVQESKSPFNHSSEIEQDANAELQGARS